MSFKIVFFKIFFVVNTVNAFVFYNLFQFHFII